MLSQEQQYQLEQFLDLLTAGNERMNLTRIVDRESARVQHVGDSLALLPFFPASAFRLADVGSGGGVPGIVLAIARPDASIVLIESTKKKAAFLNETIKSLALKNISVVDDRVERVAHDPAMRGKFDIVTARAVATIVWLVEWCLPLVKTGGKFLAMKGPKVHEELGPATNPIKLLGGSQPALHPVQLAGAEQHLIVEIIKTCASDRRFPRDPTIAKNAPMT